MATKNTIYATMIARMERRNAEIKRLRSDGWKLERIASRFGISKQRVYQVLARQQ